MYPELVQFVRTGAQGSQARSSMHSKKVRRFVRDFANDREYGRGVFKLPVRGRIRVPD